MTAASGSAIAARALVAGVGNVLLGDDGFGVEVAARLSVAPLPSSVRVAEFGVRALHLAFELLNPYELVVIVDAMSRGAEPGTLVVLEPSLLDLDEVPLPDAHGLGPAAVLRIARALGARLDHVRILGCEPAELDEHLGLSQPVGRAVEAAVRIVHDLVRESPAKEQGRHGPGQE